jgi:outer membrane protein insertion porin family
MRLLLRLCGLCALFLWLPAAWGQLPAGKISRIDIRHVGPPSVSDELIRANIHIKPGDVYDPYDARRADPTIDDVTNLYATGLFYNIRVAAERADDGGVALVYIVQGKPRLTDIKFQGNKKFDAAKLKKKVTSKVGQPLDEMKLFTDAQAIQEMYQKAGCPGTKVTYVPNIDESTGRGTATFDIKESPKIKIVRVEFAGASAFNERKLRKEIKTRKHWLFSWLTGSGVFKDDQFEDDRDRLAEFYRDNGYIDFEIKDVQFENPTPTTMVIRFNIYEGRQYKVGAVTFNGTTMFPTNKIDQVLKLKPGAVFVPKDLSKDIGKVEDFYGAKGHIDVTTASPENLSVRRVANTETGTMDLEYDVNEGQKSYIEKIEITGNTKTKDRVIRRELAVSPGEVFDMVRVKVSKQRLEGLNYFEKVDVRPEPTDPPIVGRQNLIVGVEEKNTGNLMMGAGFSSVDSVVGFAEVTQGNFDLFHPPTFTGAGQKFRLRVQMGTQRQDYILTFTEPWFLGRKLELGTELYYRRLDFQSVENIYDEVRAGGRVSLTRALGSDFLIGSVSYTLEEVGILLNSGFHDWLGVPVPDPEYPYGGRTGMPGVGDPGAPTTDVAPNVPPSILAETGYHLLSRVGASIAYDTRNSTGLPDAGQRTELTGEVVTGDKEFYKLELKTMWFFRGFAKGHVLELDASTGLAGSLGSGDVPFYERYYLGGMYSLRGFKYRTISPRDPGFTEPIGGDTYWFGSAEYSVPIIQQLRFAVFGDIGSVAAKAFSYGGEYDADWGFGMRLNIPHLGPLRLDYGIPFHHDQYNSSSGQFQFGVGYQRPF